MEQQFMFLVHSFQPNFNPWNILVVVCCGAVDGECLAVALVVISLHQWELNLRIVELLDVVTTSLGGGDLFDSDNLK